MLKTTAFLLALALALPASAQPQPAAPPEVFFDCVVLDLQGRPVNNLRKDDIVVMEDDIPHQVDRLEISGSGEAAEFYPVVLVLAGNAASGGNPEAVAAALEALGKEMRPGYQIAVFRLGEQLELLLPFSDSAEEVAAALKSSAPGRPLDPHSVPPAGAPDWAAFAAPEGRRELAEQIQRVFADSDPSLKRRPESSHPALIQAVSRALSGVPGRKTLILLGSGLQSGPLDPSAVQRTIELANAFRLTVYSADEAPAKDLDDRVGRSPKKPSSRPSPLLSIVHHSGGFALTSDSLPDQLQRALYEARRHYRLYYRSSRPQLDGRNREVYLRLRSQSMESRNRSGYPARPPGLEILDQKGLQDLETIRQTAVDSPMAAELGAAVLQRNGLQQNVLVSLGIPASSLRFRNLSREGREGRMCQIHVNGLLRDASGAVLNTFGGPLALNLDAPASAVVDRDGLALNHLLHLVPGSYTVQAGILDELGGSAAWLEKDLQVEPPQDKLLLGPVLMGRQDRRPLRGRDALALMADGFVPSAGRTFSAQGTLSFAVEIHNAGEAAQLYIRGYLDNALGSRTDLELEQDSKEPGIVLVQGSLDLSNLAEGSFQVVIEVSDNASRTRLHDSAPFQVKN